MQVLISGGAGFIGSRLSADLLAQGHEVVVFDSLHPQVHTGTGRPADLPAGAQLISGDVADAAAWDRVFKLHGLPDTVVHLAAETGTGQSLREATRHGEANVIGTTQLLDALTRHDHRPGQLVLTSSRAVYGEGAWSTDSGEVFYPEPRSERMLAAGQWSPTGPDGSVATPLPHAADSTWPRPTNIYAATKLAQEHLLTSWSAAFDVPVSILRLQNVYGPGQSVGNSYTGVLTFFARQIALGEQLDVYEDGDIIRDFVFVGDVVAALGEAIRQPADSSRVVDIGGGIPTSLLTVAMLMCSLGNMPAPVVSGRYRNGDVRAASASIAKAGESLGWTPRTSLEDGLRALLSWVATQV